MSTALIAIDDSDAATRALQCAMTAYDGIQIVKMQIKAEVPIALLRITQDELDNIEREHGRSQLVPARKPLVDAGRPYRGHVLSGDPARVVSNFDADLPVVAANFGVSVVPLEVGRRSALDLRTIPLGDLWAKRSFAICCREFEALQPASQRLVEHLQLRAAQVEAAP